LGLGLRRHRPAALGRFQLNERVFADALNARMPRMPAPLALRAGRQPAMAPDSMHAVRAHLAQTLGTV
ncbi:MAG: hypothetical protein AB7G05_14830, partial [Hyphomonadaceae bacterium]